MHLGRVSIVQNQLFLTTNMDKKMSPGAYTDPISPTNNNFFRILIKSVSRRAYTDPLFTGLMEEAYKEWELLEKQTGVELVRCQG